MQLKNAILETLAYSDVFDYPLTLDELHRYLVMAAGREQILRCVQEMDLVDSQDGYYFLAGRSTIVELRRRRLQSSHSAFQRALRYGRILGGLPFIRMVALTGSLAMLNCEKNADYDYMLVAKAGRVWMARGFALLLNRVARLFGETLCPNLIMSEAALEWAPRNLYSAREFGQMVLICGVPTHQDLRVANSWVKDFLPNVRLDASTHALNSSNALQTVLEFSFGGRIGDLLESWEMKRKVARFARQAGYGLETRFNAEICQGNFDHHGSATLDHYQKRLKELQHSVAVEA
jgi:hypothetical protein